MTTSNRVEAPNGQSAPDDPVRRARRVLLVDDAEVIRDVSRALLEDAGVMVAEAADGADAVQWLRDNDLQCDLILMDVQMPVLDGLAATRQIRAMWGERAPPVVAVTAHISDLERQRCRDAGMVDHLCKPLDPAQLMATLDRWLPVSAGWSMAQTGAAASDATAQTLPAIPGFDLAAGLVCVGGNAERLRAMLTRFGERYAGMVDELRGMIAAVNLHEAHRLAHTVKGAAATLGGTAIAAAAEDLERVLLQTPPAWEPALTALDAALQQSLPALQALRPVSEPPAVVRDTALPAEAAGEYAALRLLLAGNCYAARKAFTALRGRVGAQDAEWQAAAAAVDALDFQQALAHLDARYPAYSDASPAQDQR